MRERKAKHKDVTLIPWKRDAHGRAVFREPVTTCCLCGKMVYGCLDVKKAVTCASCVQLLMSLDADKRDRVREKLRLKLSIE